MDVFCHSAVRSPESLDGSSSRSGLFGLGGVGLDAGRGVHVPAEQRGVLVEITLHVGIADFHGTLQALVGRQLGHHSVAGEFSIFSIENDGAANGLEVVLLAVVRVIVAVDAFFEEGLAFGGIEEASDVSNVDVLLLLQTHLEFFAGPTGQVAQILRNGIGDGFFATDGQQHVGANEAVGDGAGGLLRCGEARESSGGDHQAGTGEQKCSAHELQLICSRTVARPSGQWPGTTGFFPSKRALTKNGNAVFPLTEGTVS